MDRCSRVVGAKTGLQSPHLSQRTIRHQTRPQSPRKGLPLLRSVHELPKAFSTLGSYRKLLRYLTRWSQPIPWIISLFTKQGYSKHREKRSEKTTFPVYRDYTYLVDSCPGLNSLNPGTRSFALLPSFFFLGGINLLKSKTKKRIKHRSGCTRTGLDWV